MAREEPFTKLVIKELIKTVASPWILGNDPVHRINSTHYNRILNLEEQNQRK